MTGADCLLRTAAQAGVEVCFANPGTTEMPLVESLDRTPRIRAILGLFEGVCTGAADGYGRMTGRPALTLLHLGPGFANGIANLHNARRAHSPVVNLIGDHASWHLQHDAPLSSDIESLARPVSAWVRTTRSADGLASDMAAAIEAASGPPGQVASLILPADHQWESAGASVPAPTPSVRRAPEVPRERVEELALRLRSAAAEPSSSSKRCAILLGGSSLSERGQQAAARIAAATGATVYAETFPARWTRGGGLPPIERLPYFPEQVLELLQDTGTLLLAGAREPIAFFAYPGQKSLLAPPGSIALLSSVAEDSEAALEALAEELNAPALTSASQGTAAPARPPPDAIEGALNTATIGAALAACLPEAAIVVEEAATSGLAFYPASAGGPRHDVLTLTGGAIGQGLPCATGAAVACPDRPVIAFQADGSGLYTLQALWTQAREGLHVVTLVCANRAYRILQVELARSGVAEPGPKARSLTNLSPPSVNWVALSEGLGVPARRVNRAEDLVSALRAALAEPGPQLIELVI